MIYSSCKKQALPPPEIILDPGGVMIRFMAPADWNVHSGKVTDKVTESERDLLMLLSEDPGYTMSHLATRLGVSRKTVALRLKKLKEKGTVERVGSDRSGYWKIN